MHRWESSTREPPWFSEPCGLGTSGTERHCSLHQRSSEKHLFTHREHWSCPFMVPFQCFQLSARHQLSPQTPPPSPSPPSYEKSESPPPFSCGKTEAPRDNAISPMSQNWCVQERGCAARGCGSSKVAALRQAGQPPYLPLVHAQEAGQGHGAEQMALRLQKGRSPVRG